MGECVPYFDHFSPRIFYSSQQIVQSQYALGYWAQKEYGNSGMMVMPVYEAGYHLNAAFYKGACAAGADTMGLHVLPKDPLNINNFNLSAFFSEIEKNPPSYVHAIFTGSMANAFIKAWRQSAFYNHIPLVVVENIAYDDVLEDVADLDIEMFSATTWSRNSENVRNKEFVTKYENTGGQMANIYGLLGYEAGLALKEVKHHILKRDLDTAAKLLQKESVSGPRGERNFYPLSGFSLPLIDILKISTSHKKIYKTVLSQGRGLKFDSPDFKEIYEEGVSGWQNPYMCI
jgi:branched-chain amino acid transport system substrate-binding protein